MKRSLVYILVALTCTGLYSNTRIFNKPRVSIITSVYKGDEFIEGFLKDITRQTIFSECELILVNANSPGNEEAIIKKYTARYPNIVYIRLEQDPGLYAVWNYSIQIACSDLITNANIDDRRAPFSLEVQAKALESNPGIDLVYADIYVTNIPNSCWENRVEQWKSNVPEFSLTNLYCCFEGPAPMWRKSMHEKAGYFNPWYTSAGDFEFWNRAAFKGCKYMKIATPNCLYYMNPSGISTTRDAVKEALRNKEVELIVQMYNPLWQEAKKQGL